MNLITKAQRQARTVRLGMVGAHVACLAAFETGVSLIAVKVAALAYLVRALGVTAGFHRLLAHGSYKVHRATQFALAACGSLATQGGPLWWVSHHRDHHRDADGPGDVHSPRQRGFWYAHLGWMWDPASFSGTATNVKDLYRFPELKALQRFYPWLIVLQAIVFYVLGAWIAQVDPDSGTSGAQMLIWGFVISTVALWHATFMVNSVCHVWGRRSFASRDDSRNNGLVALLTFGEGWHNNHHQFGYSARHGLRWWQIDVTWMLIRGLQSIGLAWDLRLPRLTTRYGATT